VNDAPVAVDDAYTIDEDGVVTGALVNVLANDSDVDNSPLSLSAVLVTGVSNGTLEFHADGGFSYAPNGNFNGIDSFTYRASDGTDESNLATVTITINAVNDAPLAHDALVLAVEDTPVSGVLQAQDVEEQEELEFGLATGGAPTKGSVVIDALTGAFTYTPGLNENGFDSFVFVVSDGVGGFDTGTVNIQIAPVNDAPVLAAIGDKVVNEEETLVFTALATDADVPSDILIFSLDAGAPMGTTIDPNTGAFSWTPTETQGPGFYSITVRVTDNATPSLSDFETIQVTVNEVDNAPSISINDVSLLEGNSGVTSFVFTASLSNPSSQAVTVNFATADGSATLAGNDYQGEAGSVTFAPGQTSQTISVLANGDVSFEPDETFTVNLSGAVNAAIADGTGLGTIRNDDGQPTISINDVSLLEGNSGVTSFVFTASLSNPSSQAVTVNFATADGSATLAGNDYQGEGGSVTFAPEQTSQTISVLANGDVSFEPDETFTVNLSGAMNAAIVDGTGLGTIRNDDAATGGIDLVGAVEWDPPAVLIPGDHGHVTVVVSNIGDATVLDQVKVKLYASVDGVLDASDLLLDEKHTGSDIEPGGSKHAQLNFKFPSTLLPGDYFLLAAVDPANLIAESNEFNNTALSEEFDFRWMFGSVPGHGREALTVRDADGTWVNFALIGPGTGEITIEDGEWDLVVTGTSGSTILSILTLGGGDHRVAIDDIHVTGALRGILAPKMDLTGTLAIDGTLGAGMMIGSATDAVIAVETILGSRLLGLGVQGIAILGDLENSEILIGGDLGADGQLGGFGVDADTYSGGDLGDLLITGSMISSSVRVGQDPVDGILDNGNDVLLDGSIDSITILGEMIGDSGFVADDLPLFARIDGVRVSTETDPRFVDSLPSFDLGGAGGAESGIDWNAQAGAGWDAGYSPFGNRQSNFSEYLLKLFS
jgi:VCBS repeat-containing protein